MPRFLGFDHIDSRVQNLARVEAFYDRLLPWLGMSARKYVRVEGDVWTYVSRDEYYNTVEYVEEATDGGAPRFFGVIEDPQSVPSHTRIAFRVATGTDLKEAAAFVESMGARNVEISEEPDSYPAVFFEDPLGARFELLAERRK